MADLLPISATKQERALSESMARIESVPIPIRKLWNPDTCPVELLPWLAWSLSVDWWDDEWPESVKREMVRSSIQIHRHKGTPWAVKKALEIVGLDDAEIIERSSLLQEYDKQGGLRLDGSWRCEPNQRLSPFERLTGSLWPYHWATFHVRLNIAQASKPGILETARKAVDMAKPLRSWPLWNVFLSMTGPSPNEAKSGASALTGSTIPQPANLRLDGSWTLGRDKAPARLKGQPLGFALGESIPGIVTKRLKNERLSTAIHGSKTLAINPGELDLRRDPLCRLSEKIMRLNGAWNVGTGLSLNGGWNLSGETRLVEAARLGKLPDYRLNGKLRLGISNPVCTTWPSVH
ncbi:phage tail protein I [Maridesulfovibrio hydrothermalis]|uniref:Phage tail protein I n=1 Tax=Maridesulfovibrio hydrothermalis AM13 = DSM 14728 TaxID=1121451 RepID=L0RFK5_9BACT|nr:phage tail protein I [Maridesulfovibrio hydrothermalis]CCO25534.1 protein of unknown function [Maridesulfovibrio hydrothermalis AM13 = DSM 14728]